jgi:sugar phosphate isomerase/epimerase
MMPGVNTVSFLTSNFVARPLGYRMGGGWNEGDAATQAHYRPLDTFGARFDAMLAEVQALGFRTLDLWGAMLYPAWVTPDHLAIARDAVQRRGLRVNSVAAWSSRVPELEGFCRVAVALGADLVAGGAPVLLNDRDGVIRALETHGVRLAAENHPEKTPEDLLEQIGDGAGGLVGAACDTGWWVTQGYEPAAALRELAAHLFAVHLKDVRAVGGHETCRLGDGVADIPGCVRALQEVGYGGALGIEHVPADADPGPDVLESRRRLEGWLAGA